jgi:hypothetical protein
MRETAEARSLHGCSFILLLPSLERIKIILEI